MSWEPKYSELKERALKIARDYINYTKLENFSSFEAIKKISTDYNMAIKTVYRYLNYARVELRGRSEKTKKADIDK